MASERPKLSDQDIVETVARERQAQITGSAQGEGSQEAVQAMEEGIRRMPNAIARERAAQLVGSGEGGQTEHTEAAQRVIDDIRKAMVDGDLRAFQRAHEGLGSVPGVNDVYDFQARGGLPLLSSSRQVALSGDLDGALGSGSRLGRRWQDFLDDLGRAASGDRRALGRAARNLGIHGSDLQQLYRQTAANPGLVRGWADALGLGSGSGTGGSGGDGTGGAGSGGPAGVVDEKVSAPEKDPLAPFDRSTSTSSPVSPNGGGDTSVPPSRDDADPGGVQEEGGQDSSNPPSDGDGSGEQRPRGEVTVGEGTDHGEEGARVHSHPDGGYTIYYPDGRVETYDANGEMTDSWKWDPDAVNDAGEGRPTDDAPIDSPLMPKVTWELMTRSSGPPVIGAAPVTPIDPELGEDPTIGGIDTGGGVIDPPEESDGWVSGPPRVPQGGGPVDPPDPEGTEEAPGTGPLVDPRGGRFATAARAVGRAAVGIGIFAAGFALGDAYGGRGPGDAGPAGDRPPVVESAGERRSAPRAEDAAPEVRGTEPDGPPGPPAPAPYRVARRPGREGLSTSAERPREVDTGSRTTSGGRTPVTGRDADAGSPEDGGSGLDERGGEDPDDPGAEPGLGSLRGGDPGSEP